MNFIWIIVLIGFIFGQFFDVKLYEVNEGLVDFWFDVFLEFIEVFFMELKGLINVEECIFVFLVFMFFFEGFNSLLQCVYFNENYMESKYYFNVIFFGKIIENINFMKDGFYMVRVKGQFNVYGIKWEWIICSELQVEEGQIEVYVNFIVLLVEYDISIFKIVYQKIVEEIVVEIWVVFFFKMF